MFTARNFTLIIAALRHLIVDKDMHAYIIPSGDAHQSEFIAECYERRSYISGFTGSAGVAIVTMDEALLWTDGRYYLQAENELPKFWTLMKDGKPSTPSQSKWLQDNLPHGARVGVDSTLVSKRQWDNMYYDLKSSGIKLIGHDSNLVDKIWKEKPSCSRNPIFSHGIEFSGQSSATKVANVRAEMRGNAATVLVVTELDEIAWLLNLRGSDIPYSSTFYSYAIITAKDLYLFINQEQLTLAAKLSVEAQIPEIKIQDYYKIITALREIASTAETGKVWYTPNTNYALVRVIEKEVGIPSTRRIVKLSPISLLKASKNPIEVEGYRNAFIRDAAAICELFAWLEMEVQSGKLVSELSVDVKLYAIRRQLDNFVNDSFPSVSAAGENAAIIHYVPTSETNKRILSTDVYLLDAGALYFDGTTDITRTIHLGTPTEHQKNCYTRVLKGLIALTTAIFPSQTVGSRLDSFARQFLWEAGLDYNHGTGHGVGNFLNVHEGPFGISAGHNPVDPGLRENFFTSIEPGYYEDNAFGIRLENVVRVKNVSLQHNFQQQGFLGFEDVTFVPYDHKLIDLELLTQAETFFSRFMFASSDRLRERISEKRSKTCGQVPEKRTKKSGSLRLVDGGNCSNHWKWADFTNILGLKASF